MPIFNIMHKNNSKLTEYNIAIFDTKFECIMFKGVNPKNDQTYTRSSKWRNNAKLKIQELYKL